jgi:hypothetical protein
MSPFDLTSPQVSLQLSLSPSFFSSLAMSIFLGKCALTGPLWMKQATNSTGRHPPAAGRADRLRGISLLESLRGEVGGLPCGKLRDGVQWDSKDGELRRSSSSDEWLVQSNNLDVIVVEGV